MKIKTYTPLQRLLLEKKEAQRLCHIREQRLADDWRYIRENAGHLLASELTTMFLRTRQTGNRRYEKSGATSGMRDLGTLVWQIARPIVLRWAAGIGWRIIRNMFVRKREE